MNILLTNDDGINARGMHAAYKELSSIATVMVVAPHKQRSSIGHAITLSKPISCKKKSRYGKFFGYAVTGTPADCVKFALKHLVKKKPDLIISGINLGPNDGCSVFYSGTVAAAREGCINGIPSIAVSLATFTDPDYTYAAEFLKNFIQKKTWTKIPKNTFLNINVTFLNINVPHLKSSQMKGVKITSQETVPFQTVFLKKQISGQTYYQLSCEFPLRTRTKGSDTQALLDDCISITPLKNDLTDYGVLDKLRHDFI